MRTNRKFRHRSLAGLGLAAGVATITLVGGIPGAAAQEGTILGAGAEGAIDNSYIVVLNDGSSVDRVADRHGADVERQYHSALRGFAATMSEAEAKRAAADPAVAYVEQNRTVHTMADQANPPSWGLDRIDQRDLPLDDNYSYSTTASNVTAYVIDTGILTSHSDFGGRARSGYDFVDNDSNATDCNGHGTHVAGTIGGSAHGVAKAVDLVAVRVLDCNGSGSYDGVIAGIDWVTNNAQGPAVANMSLGGGASTAVDDAVRRSINAGVTYALAAGNDYGADACGTSPARTAEAITVGSTTSSDARSSFSNIGSCLDIFAPGSSITSTWIGSNTATNTISGTSMATPHVAGAAALYLADNPSASPRQVRDALVNNGTTGVVGSPGSGSPNVLLYTGTGSTTPPEPTNCDPVTNDTNVNIPDAGPAVTSSVTVSGCDRAASSSATVEVDIRHSYRGDLVIDLVAPDGTTTRLKNSGWDSADNVQQAYTVDASASAANGTWSLRVQDVYSYDTGYINSWTFTP
ncbi:subtilisin family serine protease [Saccharomonospora amisosensis]|uniref:Subtilisin family serine protease n=1 Tax=Saccharomonospora amisosensis TaxID=1128677 RepID=A0A7X5UMK2_9PSEU|nr:S8 family peptidase [Saccharomonospora amisosensis]NIJ10790.1 subtilisin family serine protease [Saccharomonospora amisosensis]